MHYYLNRNFYPTSYNHFLNNHAYHHCNYISVDAPLGNITLPGGIDTQYRLGLHEPEGEPSLWIPAGIYPVYQIRQIPDSDFIDEIQWFKIGYNGRQGWIRGDIRNFVPIRVPHAMPNKRPKRRT